MEIRSYNHELEFANLLFSKLFRNIIIERRIGNTLKQIPVNCMIGNRSRIFKDLENPDKKGTYTLPLIVVTRTGLQVDPERIANLHNEIKHQPNYQYHLYDLMTPVPITISYQVTILSKDQSMNDLILNNFIPFFNQDLFVSCVHPKFKNIKLNSQVIMDNSISEEHPEELDSSMDDFVTSTCSFTFKTFLFAGIKQTQAGKHIEKVISCTISTWWDDETSSYMSSYVNVPVDVIYDGFVPTIDKVTVELHAVPWKDPTLPKYVTSSVTLPSWYIDENGNPQKMLSTDEQGHEYQLSHTYEIDVLEEKYDPYVYYSINKYFHDISVGNYIPIAYDTMRWQIGSDGTFQVDVDWGKIGNTGTTVPYPDTYTW